MVLHVTTHMGQVNVIVLGRQWRPVSGLTRKDFKLFDNGKKQTITVFREVENGPAAGSLTSLPADTFSNLWERSGDVASSVIVILLDALNTPAMDQAYALRQLIQFLERIHPNDNSQIAVFVPGARLEVLHDFTDDSSPLLRTVRQYRGRLLPRFMP